MIVVDASVLVAVHADAGALGRTASARLASDELGAPSLIDIEFTQAIRRRVFRGELSAGVADRALERVASMPIQRFHHHRLLARVWQQRDNYSAYDACYVAVAELLGLVLLTADARLARADGARCQIEVLS